METINTAKLSHQDWLELRRGYIGGSDVAVALGQSKYQTPYMLWLEKTGRFEFDTSNPVTDFGNIWEPYARDHFRKVTGMEVVDDQIMRIHPNPDYSMLSANVDGVILSKELGRGILELKTTTTNYFRVDGDIENVPLGYRLQIQHYLGITRYDFAYLLVYYRDTCTYSKPLLIEPNHELIDSNNQQLAKWWKQYVEQDQPPPLSNEDDLKLRYPTSEEGSSIEASEKILLKHASLKQVRQRIKDLEELKGSLELDIKEFMGDKELLQSGQRQLASWKQSDRSYFDSVSFREDYPELYKEYKSTTSTRTFRIK